MTRAGASVIAKQHFIWGITAVLLLAALLRLLFLHDIPPGLAQDEVLNADIVTFIRGGQHALFFREGFGHEPLYHYWSVPFQILLGDNVLSIRLPAFVLGMLLIAATARWVRRDFGTITAVVTALGLAVSWWPIIFSRIGIRPILLPLLLIGAAYFWLGKKEWQAAGGRWQVVGGLVAGLLLGLAYYSYTAARVVFLLPLLFGIYLWLRLRQSSPESPQATEAVLWVLWQKTFLVLLLSSLLYLPLGLTLRADPTLQQRVDQLDGPLTALQNGDFSPVWETTKATLGVFSFTGDPRWTYTLPERPLFDPITSILFYAGFLLALWRWRQPRYALILIWLAVMLLPSALTPQAPSTVRLIGAMPIVYLLPGIAINQLWHWWQNKAWSTRSTQSPVPNTSAMLSTSPQSSTNRRPITYLPRSPIPLLAAILLLNLFLTLRDGFQTWPAAQETHLKYQTFLWEMGQHWQADPVANWVISDNFFEPIDADSLRRNLNNDPKPRWGQTGNDSAGAIVLPAESFTDKANGRYYIPEFAPPAPALHTAAGLATEPLYRSSSRPSFAVYALPETPPAPAQAVGASFEGIIELLGIEVVAGTAEQPLQLFTFWQTKRPLPPSIAIFTHLIDANGDVVAQHDGFDAAATTLRQGDTIVQRHLLPLAGLDKAIDYRIQLGLYTRENGRRLAHATPNQPPDRLILESANLFDGTETDG